MAVTISFNPVVQTNFPDVFSVTTTGYVQGAFLDDPATRFELAQGIVSLSATQPMWGGLFITESLPTPGSEADEVTSVLAPATTSGAITGITTINQGAAMVQTPQSTTPVSAAGMAINFFRVGSGARIAMQATSAAATAWQGGSILPTTLYWDTSNLWLTNTSGSGIIGPLSYKVVSINVGNSKVVSYSSGTGWANWSDTGSTVVLQI